MYITGVEVFVPKGLVFIYTAHVLPNESWVPTFNLRKPFRYEFLLEPSFARTTVTTEIHSGVRGPSEYSPTLVRQPGVDPGGE